jgi:hypothetical protein
VAHGGFGFWRSLIRRDLIDVYRIALFPYVAGTGVRLFSDPEPSLGLERVSTTAFSNGITELVFRRISHAPGR